MTVYVDDMYAQFRRMKMCHMIASSHQELLEMADTIGVDRKLIQDEGTYEEHFDVCMSARRLAVAAGAIEITFGELGAMLTARCDGRPYKKHSLCRLRKELIEERGMLLSGVSIWRRGEGSGPLWVGTVGEFLDRPDYQSGTWLIDGGWGGPPGPIEVDWIDGEWIDQGHLGERRNR